MRTISGEGPFLFVPKTVPISFLSRFLQTSTRIETPHMVIFLFIL